MASTEPISARERPADADSRRFLDFVAHGDAAVLDRLVRSQLDRIYSQAYRLLGNRSEAEDAVQEALLQLVRTAARYDGSVRFGAWLGRLVHLASLEALRSRGRQHRLEQRTRMNSPSESGNQQSAETPDELIRAAVSALPERYRSTIDLHYFGGLELADVAKTLGLKEGAVAVRLHRAREFLRSFLQRRGLVASSSAVLVALASAPSQAAPPTLSSSVSALIAKVGSGAIVPVGSFVPTAGVAKIAVWALACAGIALGSTWYVSHTHRQNQPFSREWNFERDEKPSGIAVRNGSWKWVEDSDGKYMQTSPGGTVFEFEVSDVGKRLPILITMREQPIIGQWSSVFNIQAMAVGPDIAGGTLQFGVLPDGAAPGWRTVRICLTDAWNGIWVDGACTGFTFNFAPVGFTGILSLWCTGPFRLDDLRIEQISPADLPEVSEYRRLHDEQKRKGIYPQFLPLMPLPMPEVKTAIRGDASP